MLITLNGTVEETTAPTLGSLLGRVPLGHAVAVNGDVVPRSSHSTHPVVEGDTVEIVTAVAGG